MLAANLEAPLLPFALPAATALCTGAFAGATLATGGTAALVGVGGKRPAVGGALALSGDALLGCAAAPLGFSVGAGDRRGVGAFFRAIGGCLESSGGTDCDRTNGGQYWKKVALVRSDGRQTFPVGSGGRADDGGGCDGGFVACCACACAACCACFFFFFLLLLLSLPALLPRSSSNEEGGPC